MTEAYLLTLTPPLLTLTHPTPLLPIYTTATKCSFGGLQNGRRTRATSHPRHPPQVTHLPLSLYYMSTL